MAPSRHLQTHLRHSKAHFNRVLVNQAFQRRLTSRQLSTPTRNRELRRALIIRSPSTPVAVFLLQVSPQRPSIRGMVTLSKGQAHRRQNTKVAADSHFTIQFQHGQTKRLPSGQTITTAESWLTEGDRNECQSVLAAHIDRQSTQHSPCPNQKPYTRSRVKLRSTLHRPAATDMPFRPTAQCHVGHLL